MASFSRHALMLASLVQELGGQLLPTQPSSLPGSASASGAAAAQTILPDMESAAAVAHAAGQRAGSPAMDPGGLSDPPSGDWPAGTAQASQAAWPAGQQPKSLAAWKVDGNRLAMCWQTEVLSDISNGWSGQCVGLALKQAPSVVKCRNSCHNDPSCPVWQFNPGQTQGGCWQGQGYECESRHGFDKVAFSGGQRIQHGSIRVLKNLKGLEVYNLKNLGTMEGHDEADNIEHCRRLCYSNILCQYWQYGSDGCSVEDSTYKSVQYPLTTQGGASYTTAAARNIVAGEFIQHYCPPRDEQPASVATGKEERDPLGQDAGWRIVPYLILGTLVLCFFSCVAFCVRDYQKQEESMSDDFGGISRDAASSAVRKRAAKAAAAALPVQSDAGVALYDWRSQFERQQELPLGTQPAMPQQAPFPQSGMLTQPLATRPSAGPAGWQGPPGGGAPTMLHGLPSPGNPYGPAPPFRSA